ncbi:MAG: glycosyltransferase family 1 protein [Chitinophagia bacterium]|nr:glycosyltransferase family 1 protein [Chitinophagia bacterium]
MQTNEKILMNFCDGFTVVSKKLYDQYNYIFAPNTPTYIMHDLPNIDLLTKVSKLNIRREKTVIWIGNSKWGHRQGFIDHKGYERYLKPIIARVNQIDNSIKFVIIDRAVKTYPQDEVLAMVAQSKCTLQLSDSEGTGLPLIEAAYLGSIPLTRNVGIAPELLSRNSENFIFEKIDDFVSAIIENTKGEFPIESLKLRTKEYITEVEEEIKLINFTKSAELLKFHLQSKWISQKISSQISFAKWWIRYYISNRNRVEL